MTNYYDKEGNRKFPYKEDSTKGASILKPINYKGDILTQCWIDSRILATLNNWLEANGYRPRSLSDLVRRPLEVLVEHLVSSGQAKMIEDTNDARNMLQAMYRIKLNRGGRGGKNILHNQILTDERKELGERVALGRSSIGDSAYPIIPKADNDRKEEVSRLLSNYNKLFTETPMQSKEEVIENAIKSGIVSKENQS